MLVCSLINCIQLWLTLQYNYWCGMITRLNAAKMTAEQDLRTLILNLQTEQKNINVKIDKVLNELKAKDEKILSLETRVDRLESNVAILSNTDKLR